MSKFLEFNKRKIHPKCKKKTNILKNMTMMNDPAFQSNNTLKKYINEKLNSYSENSIKVLQKAKSFSKIKNKSKFKIIYNIKNICNKRHIEKNSKKLLNKFLSTNDKIISTSNSIIQKINNKNKKNYSNTKIKYKSFILLKKNNSNKSLSRLKRKGSENSTCLCDNSNSNKTNIIYKTPINIKKNNKKLTPLNNLNRKTSFYTQNQIYMNNSLGFERVSHISVTFKDEKDEKSKNKKLIKYKTPKEPINRKTLNQKTLINEKISNIINKKKLNNKTLQKNKCNSKEESKTQQKNNNNKLVKCKTNYSTQNKIYNKTENKAIINRLIKQKINNLLKKDESFSENECPIPMPYVKKYSENPIQDNIINENINLENTLFDKYLKEPKEEKKIPLPISQPIKPIFYLFNKNKEKEGILLYSTSNKLKTLNPTKF